MGRLSLIALFVALFAAAGRAEIVEVYSLEWMAASAPVIIQAKVSDVRDTRADKDSVYREYHLKNIQVLKGDFKPEDTSFLFRLPKDNNWGKQWQETGDTYLFFLAPGSADDAVLSVHWTTCHDDQCAIDLDHPKGVYASAMKRIDKPEEILATVKKWGTWKFPPAPKEKAPADLPLSFAFTPPPGCLDLEIPWNNELHKLLWSGSVCYIRVPAEEQYRAMAIKKASSDDVTERIDGAAMLANYHGAETTKLLTGLLKDSYEGRVLTSQGVGPGEPFRIYSIQYTVRAAAYRALILLGEKPERPVITRSPTAADIDAYNKELAKP